MRRTLTATIVAALVALALAAPASARPAGPDPAVPAKATRAPDCVDTYLDDTWKYPGRFDGLVLC